MSKGPTRLPKGYHALHSSLRTCNALARGQWGGEGVAAREGPRDHSNTADHQHPRPPHTTHLQEPARQLWLLCAVQQPSCALVVHELQWGVHRGRITPCLHAAGVAVAATTSSKAAHATHTTEVISLCVRVCVGGGSGLSTGVRKASI